MIGQKGDIFHAEKEAAQSTIEGGRVIERSKSKRVHSG